MSTATPQRTTTLLDAGLFEEGELNPSTGGRQARTLRFRRDAGRILTAELGATSFTAGVTDLMGTVLTMCHRDCDIAQGPEPVLTEVEGTLDGLLADVGVEPGEVWGVGLGLPGPVEFATARPSEPPIMPGWNNHPVRDRLAKRYDAPLWVDNEVNLLCLGELRTLAGGAALARDGEALARSGARAALAAALDDHGTVTARTSPPPPGPATTTPCNSSCRRAGESARYSPRW